ncbi:MAG: hypothetical protein JWQ88_928 [Rhodoferax sp.]|nr:hypothetical protein [Rhodoferax sp.]
MAAEYVLSLTRKTRGPIGPLGAEAGHFWATLGIFGIGTVLLTFGLIIGDENATATTKIREDSGPVTA